LFTGYLTSMVRNSERQSRYSQCFCKFTRRLIRHLSPIPGGLANNSGPRPMKSWRRKHLGSKTGWRTIRVTVMSSARTMGLIPWERPIWTTQLGRRITAPASRDGFYHPDRAPPSNLFIFCSHKADLRERRLPQTMPYIRVRLSTVGATFFRARKRFGLVWSILPCLVDAPNRQPAVGPRGLHCRRIAG
jgi:hypothetical protein